MHDYTLDGLAGDAIPNQDAWAAAADAAGKSVISSDFKIANVAKGASIAAAAAISQVLIPIPGIGAAVGAVVAAIANLIGVRGKTQHMGDAEASAFAWQTAQKFVDAYHNVPDDGKDFILQRALAFLDWMGAAYKGYWSDMLEETPKYPGFPSASGEGLLNYYIRAFKAGVGGVGEGTRTNNKEEMLGSALQIPIWVVLKSEDLERAKSEYQSGVYPILKTQVQDKIQAYIAERTGQVIDIMSGSSSSGSSGTGTPAAASIGSGVGMLALLGAGVGLMSMMGGRKR